MLCYLGFVWFWACRNHVAFDMCQLTDERLALFPDALYANGRSSISGANGVKFGLLYRRIVTKHVEDAFAGRSVRSGLQNMCHNP